MFNLTYRCVLTSTGMSVSEAATFHQTDEGIINKWIEGSEQPPADVMRSLSQLVCRMFESVEQVMDHVIEKAEAVLDGSDNYPDEIELGVASDDVEAQTMGWPTASTHETVIGMTAAQVLAIGIDVSVVPRGSTVTSAAAADAYDRGDTVKG